MVAPRRFALLGHTHNLDDLVGDTDDIDEGSTNLFFTDERARDAVGAILTDTASVDLVYTDAGAAAGTITATVLPAGVDHNSLANLTTGDPHTQYELEANLPEDVQDIVGAMLTDSTTIDFTYTDGGVGAGTFTGIVIDDSITNAKLANMVQATVKGRAAAAGTGDPTDLTAAQVATIVNSSLDHGTLTGLSDDDHPQYPLAASPETISGAWDFTDHLDILANSKELRLGASNDLRLFHDGTNSIIRNDTGILRFLAGAAESVQIAASGRINFSLGLAAGADAWEFGNTTARSVGHPRLYAQTPNAGVFGFYGYDGTSTGVGTLRFNTAVISLPNDNQELQLGASQDLRLYHDGTNTKVTNATGQLNFSSAATFTFDRPVRLKGYTVATLPAGVVGDTAYVTDALAPAFLAVIVGGGAVVTPVFYNGANWVAD